MDWILTNGNQVGVAALLMFNLLALYKGWVVLGTTHKEVKQERDESIEELKKQNTTLADLVTYLKARPPKE